MQWYLAVLTKYAVFSGRAQRAEYWFFVLFNIIIYVVLGILDQMVLGRGPILVPAYALVVLIPGIAVSVRRLHDIGKSGWWLLIGFVPIVGGLILLYFMVLDSQAGDNAYGPNPKAASA
jgi:uncharacterized membrane protein YhaH (DUF805 family)